MPLCIASVADQEHVCVEHIVQDAGSDDGTLDWLSRDSRIALYVEKDRGMYDGINRGLKRAKGEILAHLNCDEQYLPGTLAAVAEYFETHPHVDIVFADTIIVDQQGSYRFHRKVQVPWMLHTKLFLVSTMTCATFFRRKLIDRHNLFFDPKYKIIGDGAWVLRVLEARISAAVMRRFTSTFTQTGVNLCSEANPLVLEEWMNFRKQAPIWLQKSAPAVLLSHRLRRLFGGIYTQKPFSYSIYTEKNMNRRAEFLVQKPSFRWKWN